jgi:hypothetical protein
MAFALAGCSRENPWFVLNTAGEAESESSQSGTSSVGSSHGESGSLDTSVGGTGSEGSTTTISTSTSSSTTDPVDSTSTSTTNGSSASSTGDSDVSTGSSTGEPAQKVLFDLYLECPNALWSDEVPAVYLCPGDPNEEPTVTLATPKYDNQLVNAVVMHPLQQSGSFLDGGYFVDLTDAISPHLRTELWFPGPGDPTDQLTGTVFVVVGMDVVEAFTEQVPLGPGGSATIDLDLSGAPDLIELHLQVFVESSAQSQVSGLWINPKIVDLQ